LSPRPDVNALAAEVVLLLKSALAPIQERLATAETQLQFKSAESQACVTIVTDLTKENAALRERIAVLEARPLIPGPPGDPGPPGADGKDGTPGLTYQGVYQDGKSYDVGDVATWAGSTWHCHTPTTTKPGEGSKDWQLMVKRGRDGKDAK